MLEVSKSPISPVVDKLLNLRGLNSPEKQKDFLSWDLKELPNLRELKDLDKAATRILKAISFNEKIAIYGDYDVDGTTSCALLYHFFQMLGVEVTLYQPSRFVEGYGIHNSSIDKALTDQIKVLVTVDCGITNVLTAEYAQKNGIDLIITDHHKDAAEKMPECFAVVNPNRRDEDLASPLTKLAGVGVGFCLALEIRSQLMASGQEVPSLYPLLEFVALGTICDLAHLNSMNLRLVRHGIKSMQKSQYPGIRAFLSEEDRKARCLSSEKLSFGMGPMINSKGRLDHPEAALELLISDNPTTAFEKFSHLEICNKERKRIQKEVFEKASDILLKEDPELEGHASIVYSPDFHEGVIGIVASRLVETYKTPAIVFTDAEQEGVIKASARSAGELDLFKLLNDCSDLFIKFGGHKAAAGLSMNKENLESFKQRMFSMLAEIPHGLRTAQDYYDLEIKAGEITPGLARDLELLEPFGMGNAKPVFRCQNLILSNYKILKDVHVKWTFHDEKNPSKKLNGISFNYIGKWGMEHPQAIYENQFNNPLSIQFTVGINRFNGNEYLQLMVDKISLGPFH